MKEEILEQYRAVRHRGGGLFDFSGRGLTEVSGGEAEMFLDGLITNGIKALPEGQWMRAAFPNAQGRLLAVVRVGKIGGKFYFDTEKATAGAILKNLERFTLAGDFHVRDLSEEFVCLSLQGKGISDLGFRISDSDKKIFEIEFAGEKLIALSDPDIGEEGFYFYVPANIGDDLKSHLREMGVRDISAEAFEVLRIEAGLPLYGVDMDETTVVPEIGLEDLISYNKGCYIGQEVIARIHFRGHVAKRLSGLILSEPSAAADGLPGAELRSSDDKNAGKITSACLSPELGKTIALGYVRYAFLEEDTQLKVGDLTATVKNLPIVT
ncbi:MAG: glycine cleavage T C-terminal barrel domain-containing protein [Pyrinomonadaceae bacterium]